MINVAIIGGGASGLFAASILNKNNVSVTIFERLNRIGKKICVTGNGRGNLSNIKIDATNYDGDEIFLDTVMMNFSQKDTMEYFEKIGLNTVYDNGKAFPASFQASSIVDMLRFSLKPNLSEIVLNTQITDIEKTEKCYKLTDNLGKTYLAKNVVFACGGAAAPQLGTDGFAYKLLTKLGHNLIKPLPALVQLKSEEEILNLLDGIKVKALVSLITEQENYFFSKEVHFAKNYLSGPAIFDLSFYASTILDEKRKFHLAIDFFPTLRFGDLLRQLKKRASLIPHVPLEYFLAGMINKQIGKAVLKSLCLNFNAKTSSLKENDFVEIAEKLKGLPFNVSDTLGFKNAQITLGGIDTFDFDPQTMESKLCKNLYAIGEILSISGKCGGYNLQWAWSSGGVVAHAILKNLQPTQSQNKT